MSLDEIKRESGLSGFVACELNPSRDLVLMRKAHELRFQIYCLEQGFLDAVDYPEGRESDEHDAHSFHFASWGDDGDVAGYVRLVRPDPIGTFPFQNHCLTLEAGADSPPAHLSAEISRLMVSAKYRRQPDRSPTILCNLFMQMHASSVRHGIRYWYAAMERSLVRVLQRMLGIEFRQIGPVTDYYGPVAPYLIDLREVEVRIRQRRPELLGALCEPEIC
jgi:N-acyl-L-homoserine lactone synthetase